MRLAWLWWAAACAAVHALPSDETTRTQSEAIKEALVMLRSLVGQKDSFIDTPSSGGQLRRIWRRWTQHHALSPQQHAMGTYTGTMHYALATLLDYVMDKPRDPQRAPHTYYDSPVVPLWPDWDFDADKAAGTYPAINGWEQAMWGPFVGPIHDAPSPAMSSIVHNFTSAYSKSSLLDLVRGDMPPPITPTPDPALQNVRAHAIRLLESVAYPDNDDNDAEHLIRASFIANQTRTPQSDALWILGEHYLWGTHGAQPDIEKARQAYERLALMGNATAHARLGYLYSSRFMADIHGAPRSEAEALIHYTMAAQEGDWHAMNALAYRQLYGLGTSVNCTESLIWLDHLAQRAHNEFLAGPPGGRTLPYNKVRLSDRVRLGGPTFQLASGQHFKATFSSSPISYYKALSDKPPALLLDAHALHELMEQYEFLAQEDPIEQIRYVFAMYFGSIVGYRESLGAVRPNYTEAARHALALATKAWPIPILLSHVDEELVRHGRRGPLLRYVSLPSYQAYAAKKAAVLLGVMHLRGEGVPQDAKIAKVWLTRAATEGDALGMAYLGMMYEHGYGGLKIDTSRAWDLYRHSYNNTSLSLLGMAKQQIKAGHPEHAQPILLNALERIGTPKGLAFTSAKFDALYWNAGLEADYLYKAPDPTRCRQVATKFQALVHRGDWEDPVYHRGEAALDRGDVATALHAWSMAAEAGMAEAQDNVAHILDQFTSWRHIVEPRPYDALALEYWAQSAMQDSTLAQTKICDYVLHGFLPHRRSMAQAARCYRSQVDGSNDLLNKWRLAQLYEDGAEGFERDFPLAKRLYDVILLHSPLLNLTVTWALMRLHAKAFWAMLCGDTTAQRLFASYMPTVSLQVSSDWLFDATLLLASLAALGLLVLVRRHMHRRWTETQRAYQDARAL